MTMTPDQLIDTGSHAAKEALSTMLDVINCNCAVLGDSSHRSTGMCSVIAMSLLKAKFDVALEYAPFDPATINTLTNDLANNYRSCLGEVA